MNPERIISILRNKNLLSREDIQVQSLTGGVSSDIFHINDGERQYVIKQALPKLKVDQDWYADTSRNRIEQDFMEFMQSAFPGSVPEMIYRDREHGFFVMEYLDAGYRTWKEQLLNGKFETETAKRVARLLAGIHTKTHGDPNISHTFDDTENFYNLRIEPYLIATGRQYKKLETCFLEEADRLTVHRQALVHGDFSPKNVMVKDDRLILLDHEAAWFGDPAFDLAFFLNHLYLKMLYGFTRHGTIYDLTEVAQREYWKHWVQDERCSMELRTGKLLLMLMLARVDGKSPVEYLSPQEAEFIRSFVCGLLPQQDFLLSSINGKWRKSLQRFIK